MTENDEVKLPSLEEIREQVLAMPEIQPVPEAEPEFKTTLTPEQAAVAVAELRGKPYGARHPELGKMFNCPIHGFRHRKFEFDPVNGCVQKFTYTLKDADGRVYEQFREEEDPETKETKLVPDYRTAIHPDSKPTLKQVMGRAQFVKKRWKPHFSKIKLQFIERTRVVYDQLEFAGQNMLLAFPKSKLQTARIIAARQIRKEHRLSAREVRRRQDQSRRINRGLI